MSYQVLARKWRPQVFSQLVGQEHVVSAISNALDNNRLHHAYLFTGTRGVGKTTIARIFAKSLNCETGQSANPCGQCNTCQDIEQGRFVDLLEIDAASRTKVEDTRELLDNVQYRPTRGEYKVYLIDEVHMLSKHSFNALLKTLEEPPPHVKFLLATTDPQKLPVTILSRCLQFNLKALSREQISQQLEHVLTQEGITFDASALGLIARAAQGSMRDALSLTDQAIAQGNNSVAQQTVVSMLGLLDRNHVLRLAQSLANHEADAVMTLVEELSQHAPDFAQVLHELNATLHQVALTQIVPDACRLETNHAKVIYQLAKSFTPEHVQLLYQIGVDGLRTLNFAPDPRTGVEMILMRMLAFSPTAPLAAIENIIQNPPQAVTTEESQERFSQRAEEPEDLSAPVPANANIESVPDSQSPPVMDELSNDEGHDELLAQQAAIEAQAEQYREAEPAQPAQAQSEEEANLARTKAMLEMQQRMSQLSPSEVAAPVKKSVEEESQAAPHASQALDEFARQQDSSAVDNESIETGQESEQRNADDAGTTSSVTIAQTSDRVSTEAAAEDTFSLPADQQPPFDLEESSAAPEPVGEGQIASHKNSLSNQVLSTTPVESEPMIQSQVPPTSTLRIDSHSLSPRLPNGTKLVMASQLDDWAALIEKAQLAGLAKQVAIHSAYKKAADVIVLDLAPAQEHLLNDGLKQHLQQALSKALGETVSLQLTIAESESTPFKLQQRIDTMRQAFAEQVVNDDQSIQHLIKTFNGNVLQDSIKPQ
ncbi:DNA polymerase III subunit gamma/tau [Alteromonas flava]|uniref:DNA polymerase III subunit gamma/tau n=1 Tax=Alteromonas flava TaxID=2048003 RepID=UPI000C28D7C3|nr:DNA polymerase III subunit gamma/tau [Alteromonas flava]